MFGIRSYFTKDFLVKTLECVSRLSNREISVFALYSPLINYTVQRACGIDYTSWVCHSHLARGWSLTTRYTFVYYSPHVQWKLISFVSCCVRCILGWTQSEKSASSSSFWWKRDSNSASKSRRSGPVDGPYPWPLYWKVVHPPFLADSDFSE